MKNLLCTLLLVICISDFAIGAPKKWLFKEAEFVDELTPEDFVKMREDGTTAIVEFYSSSCSQCILWSAFFQTIAKDNQDLPIRYGGVNCSVYQALCAQERVA
ncbi:unnamed protein product, partial [Heterosigma akashiwo]